MRKNQRDSNGRLSFELFKAMRLNHLLVLIVAVEAAYGYIHLSHESAIKHAEETFLVSCKDMSGRQVEWSGPKGPLGPKTQPKVEVASYGTSILFTNVNVKDSGNYTCTAGQDQKKFHLTVKTPLTFMDTSPIQTGRENTPITLRCEVKGDDASGDKPIVTWGVDNKDLKDERYQQIGDGLLITNVTRADNNKTFICKAMQPSTGDIREQQIQLKVEHQPVFRSPVYAKSEEAWGFIGGKVNLTCEVDAEPPPTFEWFWKKQLLHDQRVHTVNSHMSVLQIHIKDATIFGNYMCKVKNKVGTLEKIFVLQQGIQAQPPEFIELRGANSDLLDIGIHGHTNTEKMPTSQRPIGYRLQYKEYTETQWKHKDFGIESDNSYLLRNLRHNTKYIVRAATANKAGLSNYTIESQFMTLTSQADGAVIVDSPSLMLIICTTSASVLLTLFGSQPTSLASTSSSSRWL